MGRVANQGQAGPDVGVSVLKPQGQGDPLADSGHRSQAAFAGLLQFPEEGGIVQSKKGTRPFLGH